MKPHIVILIVIALLTCFTPVKGIASDMYIRNTMPFVVVPFDEEGHLWSVWFNHRYGEPWPNPFSYESTFTYSVYLPAVDRFIQSPVPNKVYQLSTLDIYIYSETQAWAQAYAHTKDNLFGAHTYVDYSVDYSITTIPELTLSNNYNDHWELRANATIFRDALVQGGSGCYFNSIVANTPYSPLEPAPLPLNFSVTLAMYTTYGYYDTTNSTSANPDDWHGNIYANYGYDLVDQSPAVPEPSTFLLLGAGLGGLVLIKRKSRKQ